MYCKKCGTKNEKTSNFCSHCKEVLNSKSTLDKVSDNSIKKLIDPSTMIWAVISILLNLLLTFVVLFRNISIILFLISILVIIYCASYSAQKNKFLAIISYVLVIINIIVYFIV